MPHDTPEPKDPLQQLSAKIDAMRQETEQRPDGKNVGENQAVRLVSDFGAAALVGCALGYACDAGLNTAPWGLIVGLFLGVAAGAQRMLQHEEKRK